MRRPNFFIAGAPRCGTTALFTFLKAHPDIGMAEPKEPVYFGQDLEIKGRFTLEGYLACFAEVKDEKRVGEASTIYLYSKQAAQEIKEFEPEAKIIITLRNPVEFIYAAHSRLLMNGTEEITDFKTALAAEDDRKKGLRIPKKSRVPEVLFYKHMATFSEQVQRYFDVFGRENVRVNILDDMAKNPAEVYRGLLEFLDLDPDFQPDFRVVNSNSRVRNLLLERMFVRGLRQYHPTYSGTIRTRIFGKFTRRFIRWNTVTEGRRSMDPELKSQLQEEFEPEVKRLGEVLGRDLSQWSARTEKVS